MSIENLLKTNVNDHTEKKGNLTYLSWAWAWAEALKADQKVTYKVEMFDGKCFMEINGTAMVWVTVTLFEKPITCQLPVMDNRNKAIPKPDAFQVNTAIMRCMTKALSLHGLGLYIYAGEDLPDGEEVQNKIVIHERPEIDDVNIEPSRLQMIERCASSTIDYLNNDDIYGAYDQYIKITDRREKTALWAKLPANVKDAIKKHAEIMKLKGTK